MDEPIVDEPIDVEVAYVGPEGQRLCRLTVPRGTTVLDTVARSGILDELPGVTLDATRLGIFSRRVEPEHVVEQGDRVEIYRPLILDPMEARRRRARRDA
jgi:putative ubiquitin-RnfH superfamily antitoxin RatB of RatAB toxin-antitoxin module